MSTLRTFKQSFNAGELTDEFFGRIDDGKYPHGLSFTKNCYTLPHGPLVNRPGTYHAAYAGTDTLPVRLVPFTFSVTQSLVLEFGHQYIRMISNKTLVTCSPAAWSVATAYVVGDLVRYSNVNYYCIVANTGFQPDTNPAKWTALIDTTGGAGPWVYNIPAPYVSTELRAIRVIQSADVLTIVHPNHVPRTLNRYGTTTWKLLDTSLAAPIAAPTGVTATPTGTGAYTYKYVVTALASDGISESVASALASCTNNLLTSGNFNTISWSTVSGNNGFRIYRLVGGLYGFIGQTDSATLSIVDDNIKPDTSKTPPLYDSAIFAAADGPRAVAYFEGRKWFAGSVNNPQHTWATRSGTESDMSYSIPIKDDDRISFRIAARDANAVMHLVPLQNLVALTATAVWVISSTGGPVTPSSIYAPRPHAYVGANDTSPLAIDNAVVFVGGIDNHFYALTYSLQSDGYVLVDLSLRAPHLFDPADPVVEMSFMRTPHPTIFAVLSSGAVLSASYIPQQEILAWHRFIDFTSSPTGSATTGAVSSMASIVENGVEVMYLAVHRGTKTRIEYMLPRKFATDADAHFVDAGIVADGSSGTISGLSHLEGSTVNILGDGIVQFQKVVTSGAVTLDKAATTVHVGLPIHAEAHTLPIAAQIDSAFGQGRTKNVSNVFLNVKNTLGIYVGPYDGQTNARSVWYLDNSVRTPDKLLPMKLSIIDSLAVFPTTKTGQVPVLVSPQWSDDGRIVIAQPAPLPFEIVSFAANVSIGG